MAYRAREDFKSAILTDEEVEELVQLRKQGLTLQELAERFDVHENTVRNVLKRVGVGT